MCICVCVYGESADKKITNKFYEHGLRFKEFSPGCSLDIRQDWDKQLWDGDNAGRIKHRKKEESPRGAGTWSSNEDAMFCS